MLISAQLELPYRLHFRFDYNKEVDARLDPYHRNLSVWDESRKQGKDLRENDSQRQHSPPEEGEIRPALATTNKERLQIRGVGGITGGSSTKVAEKTTEQESDPTRQRSEDRVQARRVRRRSRTPPSLSIMQARQTPAIPATEKRSAAGILIDSEDEDVVLTGHTNGKAADQPCTGEAISVEDKDRKSPNVSLTGHVDEPRNQTSLTESNPTTLRQEGSRVGSEGSASDQNTVLDGADGLVKAKSPQAEEHPVCADPVIFDRREEARRKRLLLEAENAALEKEVAEREALELKEVEEEEARLKQAEAMNEMLKRKKARLIRSEPKGVAQGTIGNAV